MELYLDNASTTKPDKTVIENFNKYILKYSNPSAVYSTSGIAAKNDLNKARKQVADYIGAEPEEIYFTSGSTESNNWAIKGFISANDNCMSFITDQAEHPSVFNVAKYLLSKNELHIAVSEVDSYGRFLYDDLKSLLKQAKDLDSDDIPIVSVMMANNETGVINDISSLAKCVHEYGGVIHVDATQAITHMPINVKKYDIDMMSASGHKFGCFSGIGFLYIKSGTKIDPLLHGGHQEFGMRGGTENYGYAMCLGQRLEDLKKNDQMRWLTENRIANAFYNATFEVCKKNGLECHSNSLGECIPNIKSITIPKIAASDLITLMDGAGITISAGSACNSGTNEPSRVLMAIGLNENLAKNTIRISVSADTPIDSIGYYKTKLDGFLKLLKDTEDACQSMD